MKARKRNTPWQPIPTIRMACSPRYQINGHSPSDPLETEPCTAKALKAAAKKLAYRINQVAPDPTPANLAAAFNGAVQRHNVRWGGGHEHANFYHHAQRDEDSPEFKAWLANPRRHEHGFSSPAMATPGYTPGPLAHDEFGAGLIGQEQHRNTGNPYLRNGKWSSHLGDWDRAVRAWEDAA